ncbi:MAG: hypothetical protein R3239_04375, partial [Thermodesulfobacteriota bacterium]|nr:hypothetical protein [Thermodesulfobacteriota bacterium]
NLSPAAMLPFGVVTAQPYTGGYPSGSTPYAVNTKGVPPGEYRIQGEAFVWGDSYEFDNSLKVKEPLVLLPVGAAMPTGKEDGGTAVAVN